MSVLLFLLSNYKAWKFPLRKTAPCHVTWELCALCQKQALLRWKVLLVFAPDQTVQYVLFREWDWFEQTAVDNYHLGKSKFGGEYIHNCQCYFGSERLLSLSIIYHLTTVLVVTLPDDSTGNLEDFWITVSQIGSFSSNQACDVCPMDEKVFCYVQWIWHRSGYCPGVNAGRCRSFVSWFR